MNLKRTTDGCRSYSSNSMETHLELANQGNDAESVTAYLRQSAATEQSAVHIDDEIDSGGVVGAAERVASDEPFIMQVHSDCSGVVDEDAVDRSTWWADEDGDGYGYGDSDEEGLVCQQTQGCLDNAEDCDDTDPRGLSGRPGLVR